MRRVQCQVGSQAVSEAYCIGLCLASSDSVTGAGSLRRLLKLAPFLCLNLSGVDVALLPEWLGKVDVTLDIV